MPRCNAPLDELISQLAALEPPPPDIAALLGAMQGNDAAITQFVGVLDGSVSAPEFFAPENIGAIMAAAQHAGV